jgi:hypothetical protein
VKHGTRGTRHTVRADAVLWSLQSVAGLGMSPYLTILIGVAMIGLCVCWPIANVLFSPGVLISGGSARWVRS